MLPYLRSSGTKYSGDGPAGTCSLQRGPIKSAKPESEDNPESVAFIDLPALVRSFAWPPRASTLLETSTNRPRKSSGGDATGFTINRKRRAPLFKSNQNRGVRTAAGGTLIAVRI